jgi:glycosyltransferase involved in cell wall biosynthesis
MYRDSVLIVVGSFLEEHHRQYILNTARFYGAEDSIRFMGFRESDELDELIAVADISVNLRYPTFGETSATLLRALAAGTPCLVTDINQYREYPDKCAFKIPANKTEETELMIDYFRYFIRHPEDGKRVKREARAYILENHTLANAARQYEEIFLSCMD